MNLIEQLMNESREFSKNENKRRRVKEAEDTRPLRQDNASEDKLYSTVLDIIGGDYHKYPSYHEYMEDVRRLNNEVGLKKWKTIYRSRGGLVDMNAHGRIDPSRLDRQSPGKTFIVSLIGSNTIAVRKL